MTDREQRAIFAKNLKRLLSKSNMSQADVAKMIDVSPQTFNTWCQEKALPRMGKVQRLADFFGVTKSELIDEMDDPAPDPLRLRSTSPDSVAPPQRTLSPDESGLLDDYEKLNEYGKKKIREDLHDMTQLPKYTQESDLWEMDGVS